MKTTLLLATLVALSSCFNKADIPNEITASVSGETTSRVIHTVEISAQLEQIFRGECESLAIQGGLVRDTPEFEVYVSACISQKSQEFIANFLAFIQSQQEQQGGNQ